MKNNLKSQCILHEQFITKNNGSKTGYMAYHDPDLFFVVYLAYVNMSILDQKYLERIPELMDLRDFEKYLFNQYLSST